MRSGYDKKRKRRSTASRRRKQRRAAAPLFALCVFAAALIWICISTSFVSVHRVSLVRQDLPSSFDGTKILFVSDIDAGGFFGGKSCADLVRQIASFGADILILGGDYSYSGGGSTKESHAFFAGLSSLSVPLGKFAVTGERDEGDASLRDHMAYAGFRCLDDSVYRIEKGTNSIVLAGFGSCGIYPVNPDVIYETLSPDDFVICAAHDPAALPAIMAGTSASPGVSCRLILTGHTHGGQIDLFGSTLFPLDHSPVEKTAVIKNTAVVYSSGLGCEKLPFRIGTRPDAILVTLQRQ